MKRKIVISLLLASIMATLCIPGMAATVLKNIKVELNTLAVNVNGKALTKDNIVYNGNVYIRADKVSTALGKTFAWDKTKKTVSINDKVVPKITPTTKPLGYSYSNPAPIGTIQNSIHTGALQSYNVDAKVTELIRGDKAWEMILAANQFNDAPKEGYEYILAKIYFKVNDITKDQQFDLNSTSFTLVSSTGKDYDLVFAVAPDPVLDAKLYKDASNEGYSVYMVKKDDLKPKLVFGRDYNGTGGIWFQAYN